jgi:hypothetical protein
MVEVKTCYRNLLPPSSRKRQHVFKNIGIYPPDFTASQLSGLLSLKREPKS